MEYMEIIYNHNRLPAALFTIEGEVMNVLVKEPDAFKAGNHITCLIEKEPFQATVLKKNGFNLFLFVPLTEQKNFSNRRKSVRCPLNETGHVTYVRDNMDERIKVQVLDISMHGVGLLSTRTLKLNETYLLTFQLSEEDIAISLLIKNEMKQDNQLRYGCTIQNMSDKDRFRMRKFILTTQLNKI